MRTLTLLGCLAMLAATPCGADDVRVSHLYELSDFNGAIPYSDVVLHADRHHDEIYAVFGNDFRVFNRSGMEIYRFQHDAAESRVLGLVVDEKGEILTLDLASDTRLGARTWSIGHCDYRGESIDRLEVSGLPARLEGFLPNRIAYHAGRIVLLSTSDLQVVTLDRSGRFQSDRDLVDLLDLDDSASMEILGFSVDRSGNLLFTIPVLFKAYVVAPDGSYRAFGSAGSGPGKFGIAAGIAATDDGHVVIADKLRRVVMVFDPNFQLVTEYSGTDRWTLSRPTNLVLGNGSRVYITQSQKRGVAVLSLSSASGNRSLGQDSVNVSSNVRQQGL